MTTRKFYRVIRWSEPPDGEPRPKIWMFACDHLGNVNLAVLGPEAFKAWEACRKLIDGPVIGGGRSGPFDAGVQCVEVYEMQPVQPVELKRS